MCSVLFKSSFKKGKAFLKTVKPFPFSLYKELYGGGWEQGDEK